MIRPLALALVVSCAFVGAVGAQNTRADLLRQATTAYDDFAPARALEFARAALDPGIGVPDSTWVRTVHLMTHVLLENGDATLAGLWARWAMRTWPAFEIDSVGFLPAVVAQLRSARASVASRTAGDDVTRMVYQWPARGSTQNTGQLRLGTSAIQVPVNVVVRDARGTSVGVLAVGPGLALAAGTYDLEIGASGFLPIRIQREVLPGVALTFSFDLTSAAIVSGTIGEPARQSAYRSTAALAVTRFGTSAPLCAGGAVAGGRLLLTTNAAIRGASALTATIGGAAVAGEVRVAAYDISRNLAVLALPAVRTDSLLIAPLIVDG